MLAICTVVITVLFRFEWVRGLTHCKLSVATATEGLTVDENQPFALALGTSPPCFIEKVSFDPEQQVLLETDCG